MNAYALITVAIVALVTALIRFFPFFVFKGDKSTPGIIVYLGKVLPYSIMGMLVVFCLKNINLFGPTHAVPEIISCVVVACLHTWKRNTLLSIVSGTICYMFLIQVIFK